MILDGTSRHDLGSERSRVSPEEKFLLRARMPVETFCQISSEAICSLLPLLGTTSLWVDWQKVTYQSVSSRPSSLAPSVFSSASLCLLFLLSAKISTILILLRGSVLIAVAIFATP